MSYGSSLHSESLDLTQSTDVLKAIAEHTRLRILLLLSAGDLSVSDLTNILKQSQPRISRHLKILLEARLIARYQEGSWAYFRLSDAEPHRSIVNPLIQRIDPLDPEIERDFERLKEVRAQRQQKASEFFAANAREWDALRNVYGQGDQIEAAMLAAVRSKPFQSLLDLGTGTGQMLALFAPYYARAVGVDLSRDMLMVARARLEENNISHASVRQGSVFAPPVERGDYDVVTIHQVLHYLDDPALAIKEAARALRPGGTLVIVDLENHEIERLRDDHAHIRLGFSDVQIERWCAANGLQLENTEAFVPQDPTQPTVKLWVAQDPRQLIAEEFVSPDSAEESIIS